MALSTETKSWLDGLVADGGLSAEDAAALVKSAEGNSKLDEYIKGSALRQSEFSRRMSEVDKAKTDLATKEAEVTNFQTQLGTWKAGADKEYQRALKDAEDLRTRVSAAQNRVRTLAVTYGISEDEIKDILESASIPNPNPNPTDPAKPTPSIDTSKFVTRDEANNLALLDAAIHDLNVEHQKLFGTPLPGAVQLVQEAMAAGTKLTEFWANKYRVEDRRKEIAQADFNKRVEEEVTKRIAAHSADSIPGSHLRPDLAQHASPIFREGGFKAPDKDHLSGGGVSAAVAAFNAGKFRGGSSN